MAVAPWSLCAPLARIKQLALLGIANAIDGLEYLFARSSLKPNIHIQTTALSGTDGLSTGLNAYCYRYANPSYIQKKYLPPPDKPSALVRAPGRIIDYK
jgi:hypothetical protein